MVLSPSLFPALVVGAFALFVLVRSAGVAVDRLVGIAQAYDVPDALIASSIIAVGTSLPEIAAHLTASVGILSGTLDYDIASATALGGNVGSSTLQLTLLVGVFLVGVGRYEVTRTFRRTVFIPMVAAAGLTLFVAWDRTVSRPDGLLLVAAFLTFTYYSFTRRQRTGKLPDTASTHLRRDGVVTAMALAAVMASAFVVLEVVESVVLDLGLGGSVVGLVTVGVAAALPELSTVMESLRRNAPNVAMGTLIGSNVVNLLVGIGLGGLLSTYSVPTPVVLWSLPFQITVGLGLLAWVNTAGRGRLTRREGFYLVVLYFVFVGVHLLVFPGQ